VSTTKGDLEKTKLEAEISKLLADTNKLLAEAETARYEALVNKIAYETSASRLRTYAFNDTVTGSTVAHCVRNLMGWIQADPTTPLEIVFNSPGGAVIDGLELYDRILAWRAAGTRIDTVIMGNAASMAGVLAQAGETRRMGPNAYLMIHEVSAGMVGKASFMQDQTDFVKRLQEQMMSILASRAKLPLEEIKERSLRKDWWMNAEEALEHGFVDEILARP
jgi:ATP-dependent Clp endopeptidase proteolytic subunit ClpP